MEGGVSELLLTNVNCPYMRRNSQRLSLGITLLKCQNLDTYKWLGLLTPTESDIQNT